jgi:hypothetical protein
MKRVWKSHGTRIMGYVVAILGAAVAFRDRITALWFSDRGDQIFMLLVDIASYMLIGAGAIIVRRGYTNSRVKGEKAFRPGETPPQ